MTRNRSTRDSACFSLDDSVAADKAVEEVWLARGGARRPPLWYGLNGVLPVSLHVRCGSAATTAEEPSSNGLTGITFRCSIPRDTGSHVSSAGKRTPGRRRRTRPSIRETPPLAANSTRGRTWALVHGRRSREQRGGSPPWRHPLAGRRLLHWGLIGGGQRARHDLEER